MLFYQSSLITFGTQTHTYTRHATVYWRQVVWQVLPTDPTELPSTPSAIIQLSHHTDQQVIICVNQQHHQQLARSHPSHLMTVSYQPRWTEITVSSTMWCWASRTYLMMTQEPGLQCVYTTNNGHQPCYTDKKPCSKLPRCFRYRFLFIPRCYLLCLSLDWSPRFPAGYQHLIYSIHLALSNKLSLKDNFFCREKDYEISTKLHTNKRWGTLDHLRCHPVATLHCYVPFFFFFTGISACRCD